MNDIYTNRKVLKIINSDFSFIYRSIIILPRVKVTPEPSQANSWTMP
jgi:hypothetical protein